MTEGLCLAGAEEGGGKRGVDGALRGKFAAEEHDAVDGERRAIGNFDGFDSAAETSRRFAGETVGNAGDGKVLSLIHI